MDEIQPNADTEESDEQARHALSDAFAEAKASQHQHNEPSHEEQKGTTGDPSTRENFPTFRRAWHWIRADAKFSDWLIVFFTGVIALTTWLQWQEIHSGSEDTHALAIAAADEARGIKQLAKYTSYLAADTRKLADAQSGMANAVMRAQFSCGPSVSPDFHLKAATATTPITTTAIGQTLRTQFAIDSMGGSAIRELTVTMSVEMLPRAMNPRFGAEPIILAKGTLAANGQLRLPHGAGLRFRDVRDGKPLGPLTQELVNEIITGRLKLIVHGWVRYVDSVGCAVETFARIYDPAIGVGTNPSADFGAFMPYESHNGETIDCQQWDQRQQQRQSQ